MMLLPRDIDTTLAVGLADDLREQLETSSTLPPALGTPTDLRVAHRAERIEEAERLLRRALDILDHTIGRAAVDNRAIGATEHLVTTALAKIAALREEAAW